MQDFINTINIKASKNLHKYLYDFRIFLYEMAREISDRAACQMANDKVIKKKNNVYLKLDSKCLKFLV